MEQKIKLEDELSAEILPYTYEEIELHRDKMTEAIKAGIRALAESKVAPLIARTLAADNGLKGSVRLEFGADGHLYLVGDAAPAVQALSSPEETKYVSSVAAYDPFGPGNTKGAPPPVVAAYSPSDDGEAQSLPSLDELRAQAEALGIDHSVYGRKKRALMEAIAEATTSEPVSPVADPPVSLEPEPSPVVPTQEEPDESTSFVEDEEDGEDDDFESEDDYEDDESDEDDPILLPQDEEDEPELAPVAPVKPAPDDDDDLLKALRGTLDVTPSPKVTRPTPTTGSGRSLSEIVSSAGDDIDIDALLA